MACAPLPRGSIRCTLATSSEAKWAGSFMTLPLLMLSLDFDSRRSIPRVDREALTHPPRVGRCWTWCPVRLRPDIGTATGRIEGRLDTKRGIVEGRARVSFAPYTASKQGNLVRVVGILYFSQRQTRLVEFRFAHKDCFVAEGIWGR